MIAEWMKTAKVGDPIVCISSPTGGYGSERVPQPGRIYTIRSMRAFDDVIAVRVEEIFNLPGMYHCPCGIEHTEPEFSLENFKPPKNVATDIGSLRSLLNTTPADLPDEDVSFCDRHETTEQT